jgi:ABC-2 type transport system permease protein
VTKDSLGKMAAIARAEGLRTVRDRTAMFFIVLLPVFIILLIGISIGGEMNKLALGVIDKDGGPLAAELRRELVRQPRLRVVRSSDEEAMRAAVRHAELVAGVVIPAGYSDALRAGQAKPVEFVTDPSGQASVAARAPVAAAVDHQAGTFGAARFAADKAGVPLDATIATAQDLSASGGVEVDVTTTSGARRIPQGFNYTAPSNLVLFVFITSLAAASLIVDARRFGVTRRMLSTPTPPRVILVGQGLSRFALAVFQGLFIVVVGRVVFGVDWGDPVGAGLIVGVFALVSTGAALLMGTVARTPDQAGTMGPAVGIALGMLGGCMWPLFIVPPIMQTIGHATPHAWAMDSFIDLIGRGAGVGDIAGNVAVLAVFAAVLLTLGAWSLRRAASSPTS